MKKSKKNFVNECLNLKKRILAISQQVKAIHAAGAFSCLETVFFIYFELVKFSKKGMPIDTFIMSKGHGCMSQYVILEKLNILKKEDLDNYCTSKGILGCHPDYGNPGIEASTGSLGHGLGIAVGIAYAEKLKRSKKKTFVLLSDGELQEGSTWESLMMAANLKLENLFIFIDHNGSQSFGKTIEIHPKFYPISSKLKSFNMNCLNINGHSYKDFSKLYKQILKKNTKPTCVICNTVKGNGVSFMENDPIWHYRSPNKKEYYLAIEGLNKKYI